jgi:membrane-bound serine protease (ClpP class)
MRSLKRPSTHFPFLRFGPFCDRMESKMTFGIKWKMGCVRSWGIFRLTLGLAFLVVEGSLAFSNERQSPIVLLKVQGVINPAMAHYVTRGLELARQRQASAVVIQLDTPGGLDGSMRKIIQAVLDSPVPVVVYVAPQGARAASAGAFLVMAAHVAAMAEGTNMGAAHPVQMGGGGCGSQEPAKGDGDKGEGASKNVMDEKITNDAAAYIRAISELRQRNVVWAEAAVRESQSITANEAKEKGVVDFIADDLETLLKQVDGRQVKTVFGLVNLDVADKPIQFVPMSIMENILHRLAHPQLAYLLLLIGMYGLIYELANPGAIFPGVVGAISLIVSLVALEALEVNWGGLFLIGLALLFFLAETQVPGFGLLTTAGIIAFVLGSLMLFPAARAPVLRLPWVTIGAAALVSAGFFIAVIGAGIKALRQKVKSGAEGLIGLEGWAKTDLAPEGIVLVFGEEWQARAKQPVK